MQEKTARNAGTAMISDELCELCDASKAILDDQLAFVRFDNKGLCAGHVLIIPRRHVADFFDMSEDEQHAILALLNQAQTKLIADYAPDGFNVGVNIGVAGGQSRMHVHVHLIPRFRGDVVDPSGGIRCVLSGKVAAQASGSTRRDQTPNWTRVPCSG
jgi:diadenosine tetraphosphate (Ap4A) HIT family hydrolase